MAGSGIWLGADEYLQTQGQLWAQEHMQRVQAGQDWATQAMQQTMQRLQSMVPTVSAPAAAPAQAAPTPAPAPAPTPMPVSTPEPAPVQTAPTPPAPPVPEIGSTPTAAPAPQLPMPAPETASPEMSSAGEDWAHQAISNLTNPLSGMHDALSGPSGPAQGPTASLQPSPATPTPAPSAGPSGATSGPQPGAPGDLIDQTRQAAIAAGIDPNLFARQINQESGFNPGAQSPAGARGIAQFMPATAAGLGINPDDPTQALPGAANLMKSYLDKYGGDWGKALAAYNAGPGNVDKYGGVPPFEETQTYVKNILGGAGQAVQGAVNAGLNAVNTVTQGVQSAVARVSQFALGLSSGDAMAFCGPAAALAFAQSFGRNPTVDEAKQLAQQVGWNPEQGMAGPSSEVALLNKLGIDAHMTNGVDWAQVARDAQGGNPVIVDTPGHYYYVDGYDANTGKLHVGSSGTDLKGGSEWMSADQINAMPQSGGNARAAIFADHPLAQNDGVAQSTAAQTPLYMGTMQPAGTQSKAQDVMSAVQNVGGNLPDITGALSPRATDLTSLLTPTPSRPTTSPSRDLGADLPDITGLLTVSPKTPLGRMVAGEPIGEMSASDQAQALMQWNQQYELARATGMQNLTGNLPVVSGLASFATDPEQILALAGGGMLGRALLPGAGILPSIGREALTGGLAGGVYGAEQPNATAQDILANAGFGGVLGGIGGGVAGLPGVLRSLSRAGGEVPAELAALEPELQYSARGVALDPLTGQEMVPADVVKTIAPNSYQAAVAANPGVTQFVRTAGNQFEPVVGQAPQTTGDLLTALQNMVDQRGSPGLTDQGEQLLSQVQDHLDATQAPADTGGFLSGIQDLLHGRQSTGGGPPSGAQLGQINAAFARALGGGAAGGLGAYATTDENDPNRWLKVAGAAGAGALGAGPGLDLAVSRPGGVATADWLRAAYRGGIIGGFNTAADVAFNSTFSPIISGGTGLIRDLASFQPGRIQGRLLGAQSGIVNWAGNFLQGLSDSLAQPHTVSGRVGPGAPTVIARALEGMGALHGAFQNATSQLIQSMEHGAESGAAASAQGLRGPAWFNGFQNQFQQPVSATVQAMGDRAALRGDLGTLTGAFGRFVTAAGPIGDALFPVYRMGMALASRMVEYTPMGLAGTTFDVGRGLVGRGPYASGLGSVPAGSAVGPLNERLTNNLIGTAVSMWLASKAVGGAITGAGPTDPEQHRVWLADGNQPNSFIGPDGAFHSWEKLPAAVRGPMMMAGAYADAVQAYNAASARQQTAGPQAYGMQDPRTAAAAQLISEVGEQLAAATPMRTFADLYDALQSNTVAGKALGAATTLGSRVVGGLVPFSGEVRSIAEMTDPLRRQTLMPVTPEQLPQSISESVMQNLPGARETLPAAQDVLGRPISNPLQGLGELMPVRTAAGEPSPLLKAMQASGVSLSGTPPTVPLGPANEIRLRPDEQRAFEQYRGQIVQQAAEPLISSPQWQQMPDYAQRAALQRIDQAAQQAASRLVLRDIVSSGADPFQRAQATGVLAPVVGYGPDVSATQVQLQQALMLRNQMHHQALMNALLSGQNAA